MNRLMKTPAFTSPLYVSVLTALIVVSSGFSQGTLIGPTILNGSFEDGTLPPWFGDFTTAEDSGFATQGSWFALVENSVVFSPAVAQNLTPNPSSGLHFLLTFNARIGDPGYASLTTTMNGRTQGGAALSAAVTPIAAPPLNVSTWQSYQYELQMPEAWDANGFTFAIRFSRTSTDGVMRTAYLDSVVLQQIPEPSVFALSASGAFLCAARLLRRRCNGFGK